ncbi:photosynthetic reaction center subunit H [Lutimaribacter sp. EGI FJ00015]|uniref:Photosynthetic reaction center subunit H n=1 Tax=Lutimaribacter degradans TaxID=2945989 RepID=A0ACC5ZUM9_9RHOB|nr:photosynthetic reaction center subunit H [Lutimaribacter sp. EGI FJ00013]MCM2562054.1 photosynthetic reaction center subunit H [Lutimaribacter sp. EGI FJ00013]MCO0615079.1 photosynthetic reaction center subunit H [Lutimaribacter sp. EGI FJ00015]MCO0635886.1 photosynthetic reaction center subunit H [Lutimaribacter sp. EGI FJ00014]
MSNAFFANFDLASLTLWLFWIFFAGLIYYLQTENMREGFPLVDEDGNEAANQGLFPVPKDKTFVLPNNQGELTVPSGQPGDRTDVHDKLARTAGANGFPFVPTGNPLADGIGPASWVSRKDVPELDAHGKPKIIPMASSDHFHVSAGRDPRGLPVQAGDGKLVGRITDMWIDEPEQLVRYLEIELDEGGKRLVPMTLAKIKSNRVRIHAIYAEHFAGVPETASTTQVTKLEEDKISAYYAGGKLYADDARLEPQL